MLKHKKNKAILEDEIVAEQYYLALGQKGDKKALKVLTDGLSKTNRGDKVTRARILALGRIRDTDSVEALIDVMVSGSARRRHPQTHRDSHFTECLDRRRCEDESRCMDCLVE